MPVAHPTNKPQLQQQVFYCLLVLMKQPIASSSADAIPKVSNWQSCKSTKRNLYLLCISSLLPRSIFPYHHLLFYPDLSLFSNADPQICKFHLFTLSCITSHCDISPLLYKSIILSSQLPSPSYHQIPPVSSAMSYFHISASSIFP